MPKNKLNNPYADGWYPKIISSPKIELLSLKTSTLKNNAKKGSINEMQLKMLLLYYQELVRELIWLLSSPELNKKDFWK